MEKGQLKAVAMLQQFGFVADEVNPPSEGAVKTLCDNACILANALGIDPLEIGFGCTVTSGEFVSASIDPVNRVNLHINEDLNLTSLSAIWVGISSQFGLIENMGMALSKLTDRSVGAQESMDMLTGKWKSIEMLISDLALAIEKEVVKNSRKKLTKNELSLVRQAFRYVKGSEGASTPISSIDCSSALAKMDHEINSASGSSPSEANLSTMYMLMGSRADVLSNIQEVSANKESLRKVPYTYFERMSILAKDNGEEVIANAPGFALAAYASKISGNAKSLGDVNPNFLPTDVEMKEIEGVMKEFCSIINAKNKPKLSSRMKI